MDESIYKLLGLCKKAGRLLTGNEQVTEAIKKGKGCLLVMADDSADNTKKKYLYLAGQAKLMTRFFGQKEKLGRAVGHEVRTAVLITDQGFGETIIQKIDGENKKR